MRPHRSMGLGETCPQAQKIRIKTTLYSPIKARAMLAPTSKIPKEREFVVDSEASMLSKKVLSFEELKTLRRSRNPIKVVTANVEVQTNK